MSVFLKKIPDFVQLVITNKLLISNYNKITINNVIMLGIICLVYITIGRFDDQMSLQKYYR